MPNTQLRNIKVHINSLFNDSLYSIIIILFNPISFRCLFFLHLTSLGSFSHMYFSIRHTIRGFLLTYLLPERGSRAAAEPALKKGYDLVANGTINLEMQIPETDSAGGSYFSSRLGIKNEDGWQRVPEYVVGLCYTTQSSSGALDTFYLCAL